MADTDFTPVTPQGIEPAPAAAIPLIDSDAVLANLPAGPDRQKILGEVEPGEDLTLEQAAKKLRDRRGEQPSTGVRFEVDRRSAEPQTDREAARDLTLSRRFEHMVRLSAALPGANAELAGATAFDAEKGGAIHRFDLPDGERADPLSHGDTTEQATHRLSQMREQRANDLHALAGQLAEPQPDQQLSPAETTPPAAESQPQWPQPTQQPAAPDPVAMERAQAQAERAAYERMSQATSVEWQLALQADQLEKAIVARLGDHIAKVGGIEEFKKVIGTPAGMHQLEQADPMAAHDLKTAAQHFQTCVQNSQHCQQIRTLNESRLQELQASRDRQLQLQLQKERAEWIEQQNNEIARHVPELLDPAQAEPMQRATVKMLSDIGVSEEELRKLSSGEAKLDLQDFRAQRVLADAVRWRQAQARAREARQAPLPPVFRPGNGTTKAERAVASDSARINQLPSLSGQDGAREAARILAARRHASRGG